MKKELIFIIIMFILSIMITCCMDLIIFNTLIQWKKNIIKSIVVPLIILVLFKINNYVR